MKCFHENFSTNRIIENEHVTVSMATGFPNIFLISNSNSNKMNETERITQWVEYKIGKLLSEDIEKIVVSEDCYLDTEKYCEEIFERHFANAPEINHLKCEFTNGKLKFEADDFCLMDDFSQDSSDDDFQPTSLDGIILGLQTLSESSQMKALESLETCSAEEVMAQNSWTLARKLLQDLIKIPKSRKVSAKVLQFFRRFLSSKDTPKVVCEGFVSLAEGVEFGIHAFNFKKTKKLKEEVFDFRKSKWVDTYSFSEKEEREYSIEMIFRSMWLLLNSQKGIPYKWIRFNEKRLREIVFSFIHMISSTNAFKGSNCLCGLEITAVLDPKAKWCVNWCHGATGRLLLCSALKTHKKLLNEMVDLVLVRIKLKDKIDVESKIKPVTSGIKLPALNECNNFKIRSKSDSTNLLTKDYTNKNVFKNKEKYSGRLSTKDRKESKGNRSAPPFTTNEYLHSKTSNCTCEDDWIIKGISKKAVTESVFCHCLSIVVYLIQYRSGRSLFPVEVTSRRMRITVHDFTLTVLNYINEIVFSSEQNTLTKEYKEHLLKLVQILKSLQTKMF